MKAVFIEVGGNSNVLQYGQRPKPQLTSHDLALVKVIAAGINPIDTKLRATPERFPLSMPAILGCDAAGIVEAVGSTAQDFQPGDEVYFSQPGFNQWQGTYAEYVVVDSALLAPKPSQLSFQQAAAVPLVLITAWEALHDRAKIKSGQTVLIHAGAGGVGHVAIQLAKLTGAKVITTVSSVKKAQIVEQLGADKVINYKTQNVMQEVMDWTNGEGVDIAFDTIGGSNIQSCFSYVKVYGDVVTILQPPADINWSEARKRNLRFSFELMLTPVMLELKSAKQHQSSILRHCAKLFNQGLLKIEVSKSFTLANTIQAHNFLEMEHPIGKIVIDMIE